MILVVIAGISAYFLFQVLSIQFKYNFELFYPKNDVNTEFFKEFRQRFKSDRDFILIGLSNKKGVFEQNFLHKVNDLTMQLEEIDNVVSVTSITNAKSYKILPLYPGIYKQAILRFEAPEFYESDSIKLSNDPNFKGNIISKDGRSVCIVIIQSDSLNQSASFKISDDVNLALNDFDFDESHIAGRSLGLSVYVGLIRSEVRMFVGTSVFLILLFLFISYRSFWGLWMPALVVILAVLWTIGLMAATSKPIDLISNIIPTMLMVIGISNVIHLLSRFLDHLREGFGKNNSLKIAIKEVGVATLFTSITTAIGFMSLTTSNVQPIIDMGIYTTVGLGFCFLLSYTLFPALVILNGNLTAQSIEKTDNFWRSRLALLHRYLAKKKVKVLLIWAVIAVISGIAASQLKVNSFLLDGLNDQHPQRKAFRFFENNFSGSRPFELSISLIKDGDIMDLRNISALDSIQNFLDTSYGVGNILSPVSIVKGFNRTNHAGSLNFYKLPNNEKEHKKLMRQLLKYQKKLHLENYVDLENNVIRMQGRMIDEGSIALKSKNKNFIEFMNDHFSGRFDAVLTGAPVMMDNTHAYIVKNVFRGLIGAVILIGIIMGFLFRSWRIVVISLITNIIPLIITAGIMAINGIEMRLSTSIIFIIAFGIAVDDSIHFLSKFKHEISTGKDVEEAIRKTYKSTGKAIIVTTMILSGGFLTLSFSEFLGTHYIGIYISLTLFLALIATLTILPCALNIFVKNSLKK